MALTEVPEKIAFVPSRRYDDIDDIGGVSGERAFGRGRTRQVRAAAPTNESTTRKRRA